MFDTLTLLPSDPIYGMQALYKSDPRNDKLNLSIGICLDETGKLLRFKAIQEAEKRLQDRKLSKEYLPITGLASFCAHAESIVTGNFPKDELFSTQTVGGTGALFVAAKLLKKSTKAIVYIPEPTWPNHKQLFEAQDFDVRTYPYYNKETLSLEFEKMCQALKEMEEGATIILQASCHNPTGIDPTKEEWQTFSKIIKERGLYPLFDLAYLGLGRSLEQDIEGIRLFLQQGHEMMIATTFAKSMGLYNDRVGLLTIKSKAASLDILASHIRSIIRTTYSSPPAYGAHLANELLADSDLRKLWTDELAATCKRLSLQRNMLVDALGTSKSSHILKTQGLFCLLDISPEKVALLREKYGIYVALDGRIALAAITEHNVLQIANGLRSI